MTSQRIKEERHAISYVPPCIPGPSWLHAEAAMESSSISLDANAEDLHAVTSSTIVAGDGGESMEKERH